MKLLDHIFSAFSLKSTVIVMCIAGALTLAYIDKEQRNAFMTIAVTATGGFFGAELPSGSKRNSKDENSSDEE